jgi:hypothetical protein
LFFEREEKEKQKSPVANLGVFIGRNSEMKPQCYLLTVPTNISYGSSNSLLQLLTLFMTGKLLFMIQIAMNRLEQIASKLEFIALLQNGNIVFY